MAGSRRSGVIAATPPGARRVLILAPHPDDEIVACGIAAWRARRAGTRVFVLYLTTGVPPCEALWRWQRTRHGARVERRRTEAEAAAAMFGLEPLGFRDNPSRGLRGDLDGALQDVQRALVRCSADTLWVPAFEGGHQDHDAANALASRFSGHLPVCEFAAYNFAGGRVVSNRFAAARGGEIRIIASEEEASGKRRALACYASERSNLRHIGVAHEAWRPLPHHNYGRPPHLGLLFRERFQNLPFRHPRVDFAPSAEVYRDLGNWLSAPLARGEMSLGVSPRHEAGQSDRVLAGALDEAEGERRIGGEAGDPGERHQNRLLRAPAARDQKGGAARGEAEAFEQDGVGEPG